MFFGNWLGGEGKGKAIVIPKCIMIEEGNGIAGERKSKFVILGRTKPTLSSFDHLATLIQENQGPATHILFSRPVRF